MAINVCVGLCVAGLYAMGEFELLNSPFHSSVEWGDDRF